MSLENSYITLYNIKFCIADIMQDIEYHQDIYSKEVEGVPKKKALMSIQRALIRCQEIGDEKLGLMAVIADHIENRQRQLEQDRENLGKKPGSRFCLYKK